jgi:hypothetical protein
MFLLNFNTILVFMKLWLRLNKIPICNLKLYVLNEKSNLMQYKVIDIIVRFVEVMQGISDFASKHTRFRFNFI